MARISTRIPTYIAVLTRVKILPVHCGPADWFSTLIRYFRYPLRKGAHYAAAAS